MKVLKIFGFGLLLFMGPDPALAAPKADLSPLCTDRPTKSTGPCTVDSGHWQVETDLADLTLQKLDGVKTRASVAVSPTLKFGLTPTLDLELNPSPYLASTTSTGGVRTSLSGWGDTSLRLKSAIALGKASVAISPFIKLPTARKGLGNGKVEGGVIIPIQFALSDTLQLLFDPEVDALENDKGDGRHLNLAGLVSLTKAVSSSTSLSAELWGASNVDPSGAIRQVSLDLGVAWIPAWNSNLQWDTGVNLGLNRETPQQQVYVGLSRRF